MSRSYKKNPITKCSPCDGTFDKRYSNKKIRRVREDIPNGKSYRKIYNSYYIHDYVFRYTYQDYLDFHRRQETRMLLAGENSYREPLEYSYNDWFLRYKRK